MRTTIFSVAMVGGSGGVVVAAVAEGDNKVDCSDCKKQKQVVTSAARTRGTTADFAV